MLPCPRSFKLHTRYYVCCPQQRIRRHRSFLSGSQQPGVFVFRWSTVSVSRVVRAGRPKQENNGKARAEDEMTTFAFQPQFRDSRIKPPRSYLWKKRPKLESVGQIVRWILVGLVLDTRRQHAIWTSGEGTTHFTDPDLLDTESQSGDAYTGRLYHRLAVRVQPWTQVANWRCAEGFQHW